MSVVASKRGRPKVYLTDEERLEKKREQNRIAQARLHERTKSQIEEKNNLASEINAHIDENKRMRDEIADLSNRHLDERKTLRDKIQVLEDTIDHKDKESEKAFAYIDELQSHIEEQKREIASLLKQISEHQTEFRRLTEENEVLNNKLKEFNFVKTILHDPPSKTVEYTSSSIEYTPIPSRTIKTSLTPIPKSKKK